jgi:hypothetical protein
MPIPNPTSADFIEAKAQERQELINLIEADPPFTDSLKLAKYTEKCLALFDACAGSFGFYQLCMLVQITAFALKYEVKLESVDVEQEDIIFFDTQTHSLRVVYDYVYDEYDAYLNDKKAECTEVNRGIYIEDFGLIIQQIAEQQSKASI